jgi:lipopolysaccharide/colanic/teichoic acid biosynthesis glycosyltransferase
MRSGAAGLNVTVSGDPRITPIGRVLRRYKLDELPQLWNVLRGDLSLVGPRPEDPKFVSTYSDSEMQILKFRPGITSAASLEFSSEEEVLHKMIQSGVSFEDAYNKIMQAKIHTDIAHFSKQSIKADLALIPKTLRRLLE